MFGHALVPGWRPFVNKVYMVYFCAFARSEIFQKHARKSGVGRRQFVLTCFFTAGTGNWRRVFPQLVTAGTGVNGLIQFVFYFPECTMFIRVM